MTPSTCCVHRTTLSVPHLLTSQRKSLWWHNAKGGSCQCVPMTHHALHTTAPEPLMRHWSERHAGPAYSNMWQNMGQRKLNSGAALKAERLSYPTKDEPRWNHSFLSLSLSLDPSLLVSLSVETQILWFLFVFFYFDLSLPLFYFGYLLQLSLNSHVQLSWI